MYKFSLDRIKHLIDKAVAMESSGHPALDFRWLEEGQFGRNKHYRRVYYRFCMLLAMHAKPDLVVELGIDEGDCCAHWAHGNPDTHVVGVDVHKDWRPGMQQINPVERCENLSRIFPNFTYMRGWTWEKLEDVRKLNKPIDILYIDSWHTYDYLARDWNDYAPLLHDTNSIVLIDDLNMAGIGDAFHEIPAEEKFMSKKLRPELPNAPSFGIILRPDKNYRFTYTKQDYMP